MEKGRELVGVLPAKEGGSTRRKGEVEARRLERAPMRLCLGEPREVEMGVEWAVSAFRTEEEAEEAMGVEETGDAGSGMAAGAFEGEVKRAKWGIEGLEKPSDVFDFLVGELSRAGSAFSASSSSKMAGPRERLPVEALGLGFNGEAKGFSEGMAVSRAFSFLSDSVGVNSLTILPVLRALQGLEARGA